MNPPEPRRASIRRRLTLSATALVALVAGLGLTTSYFLTTGVLERRIDAEVDRELDELVARYPSLGEGLADEITQRGLVPGTEGIYLFASARFEWIAGNLEDWPDGVAGDGHVGVISFAEQRGAVRFEREVRVATERLVDGRHLLVGRDTSDHRSYRSAFVLGASAAFVLALVLAAGAGLAVSRGLLGRVEAMSQTVLRILRGQRSERVPVSPQHDEFDELASFFNRLLDENDGLVTRMREVTNDVAHDLRSPLSRIRTSLESALATPEDAARSAETLRHVLGETNQVLDTFNALLLIAQIESGTLREQMQEVDLVPLVHDAVDLYQPLVEEAGSSLEAEAEGSLSVQGNRHLLAQALANLLDNAVKYAGGAGPLRVAAVRRAGRVEVSVADSGPGIPEAAREHVLERFVRLDAARQLPGTGLGLSFVAAVAELHGAELRLEEGSPGLRVALVFPASEA